MRTTHITAPKTQLNIGIALQWAADPHAEVFFTTIADIIREIENPEQWLKNNQKQPPLWSKYEKLKTRRDCGNPSRPTRWMCSGNPRTSANRKLQTRAAH